VLPQWLAAMYIALFTVDACMFSRARVLVKGFAGCYYLSCFLINILPKTFMVAAPHFCAITSGVLVCQIKHVPHAWQ
jgi:hypothetical protein